MDIPNTKKRKIHMDAKACMKLATEPEGAEALTNPAAVANSSKDPNRGLYPRQARKPTSLDQHGYMTAADMLKPNYKNTLNALFPKSEKFQISPPAGSQASQHKYSFSKSKTPVKVTNPINSYFKPKARSENETISKPPDVSSSLHADVSCTSGSSLLSQVSNCSNKDTETDVIIVSDSPIKADCDTTSSTETHPSVSKLFSVKAEPSSVNQGASGTRKKPKKEPKFNRDNTFLYSQGPTLSQTMGRTMQRDAYGLLGSGNYPKVETKTTDNSYVNRLPPEIIQNILIRLPLMDLLLNASCVCRYWNEVIMDSRFAAWKKKYYRVKKDIAAYADLVDLACRHGMAEFETYLGGLILYMRRFKPVTAVNMMECLKRHPLYEVADAVIKDKLPECIENGVTSPWSIIACIVILSEKVHQITAVLTCLLNRESQCSATEVTECLYCIATFLFVFKSLKLQDIWTGMHYRLNYALYLYENESHSSCGDLNESVSKYGGQQSMVRYGAAGKEILMMTHEQLRICKYNVVPGDIVKIIAFAGTGKTTTLVRYTQMRPSMRFLMVVYNKSVRVQADKQFPPNVTCKTGHQLGFKKFGWRYKLGNLKVYSISQCLPPRKGENLFIRSKFVMDTVNTFLCSADEFITTQHVPAEKVDDDNVRTPIPHEQRMNLADDAEIIWGKMKQQTERRICMSHDGYLKLFCLSMPELTDYDVILIDEAQDMTPAVSDMLLKQTQPKILVGDPHQQIYGFRGAVNAMQQVTSSHTFYLTQSFRFGPEIASVANSLLEFLKGEKKKVLVGNAKPGAVDGSREGQMAIITRNNFTLFSEAVKKCCYSNDTGTVAFVGGTDGFGFPMIQDIYSLMLPEAERNKQGRRIQNRLIQNFHNFGDLEKYATKTMDVELLGKIRIVKTYNNALPGLIKKILQKTTPDIKMADIVLSTAHKSKGLEFDTVRLTDDYMNQQPINIQMGPMNIQINLQIPGVMIGQSDTSESNIWYVAVTRAKKRLMMTRTLVQYLGCAGERFQYPMCSKTLQKDGTLFKCFKTDQEFTPRPATIQQRSIKLSDGTVLEGGLLGPQIVLEEYNSLSWLFGNPRSACSVRGQQEPSDVLDEEVEDEDDDAAE